MTDKKLPDEDAAGPLDGTEPVYTVQGGLSVRTSIQAIKDFLMALDPVTITPTGSWLYEPVIESIAPKTMQIGATEISGGKWIAALSYVEPLNAPGVTAIELVDVKGISGALVINAAAAFDGGVLAYCGSIQMSNITGANDLSALVATSGSVDIGGDATTSLDLSAFIQCGGDLAISCAGTTVDLGALAYIPHDKSVALSLPDVVSPTLPSLVSNDGSLTFENCNAATSLSCAALLYNKNLYLTDCASVASLDLSVLVDVGYVAISGLTSLTALTLPDAQTINQIDVSGGDALATLDINSGLKSWDSDINFTGATLDSTSVDNLLILVASLDGTGGTTSYDGHNIDVSGGCAAPTGASASAITTLTGRGNTVTTT